MRANPHGTPVLVEAASEDGIDIAAAVRSMKNAYERAFWVLLEHPDIFEHARTQFHIAALPRRSWEKRNGMPKQSVEVNHEVLDALGRNLSAYYLARQVRGERCKVEYRRHAGIDTFYAYPADYSDEILGYGDNGELGRSSWNPALEVVFRYNGSAGTIESFAEGGKDVREDLAEVFARVVLHAERQPMLWEEPPFDLNVLKDRNFTFPTNPVDNIERVRWMGVRMRLQEQPGGRIALDVDSGDPGATVYGLLDATLDEKKVSLSKVDFLEATLQALFRRPGTRSRSITLARPGNLWVTGESQRWDRVRKR